MPDDLDAARDAILKLLEDCYDAAYADGFAEADAGVHAELGGAQTTWATSKARTRSLPIVDAIVESARELGETAADQRFGILGKSGKTHELKLWPGFFDRVLDGTKTFEVRRMDRSYQVGDDLVLREWNRHTRDYTGRRLRVRITYIAQPHALAMVFEGWPMRVCVMGIRIV